MNNLEKNENYNKTFEDIKHIDENGIEFWYARELMPILQYSNWQNFEKIIDKAKKSCQNSNIDVFEHFIDVSKLSKRANNAGVKNFDRFHNSGYKGLYNGETADDIAKRKGLRYREDILDNMGSEELAANLFRITQTESRLEKDNICSEKEANKTHYNIGKNIREVIEKNGGTMPEELPTPKKSLKQCTEPKKLDIF